MTISLVVNSRAESGPMASVIAALSPDCVVTRFNADGLSPAVSMAQALTYFTAMLTIQKPSRVIVLGDRYETLSAALAATFLRIPLAHIHGGETTTGAWDDPLRHAITHLADLHFVATDDAAYKVAGLMGHFSEGVMNLGAMNIHLVGAPGLDGVAPNSAKRSEKLILVTYHSETRAEDYGLDNCFAMLEALDRFPDHTVMFTPPNADPGSDNIRSAIDMFISTRDNWHWNDVGHGVYVELMQVAACVVGNSSAAVIESPWIGIPSVNIGLRQDGRPMANTVRTWMTESEFTIADAINWSISSIAPWNPIYRGGAAAKIAAVLRKDITEARQGDAA